MGQPLAGEVGLAGDVNQVGDGQVHVIDNELAAAKLVRYLRRHKPLAGLDCETVGCNPKEMAPARGPGEIVCWSIAFVLPGAPLHTRVGLPLATRVFLWADAIPWMEPWLTDASCPKVWHNGTTYDYHLFANHGVIVRGADFDTLRLSKLRNPSARVKHDLKSLMWWRLGYKLGSFKELFGRPKCVGVSELPEMPKRAAGVVYRKVGDCLRVPTVWIPGESVARVSWAKNGTEAIPLNTIRTDYRRLLPLLYDYATLDAKGAVELCPLLEKDLAKMAWTVGVNGPAVS